MQSQLFGGFPGASSNPFQCGLPPANIQSLPLASSSQQSNWTQTAQSPHQPLSQPHLSSIRQAGQRLVDVLQSARSSFSDELSRNFPRGNSKARLRSPQAHLTVICLPPGTRAVPSHPQLITMRDSGSGFGYATGSDAAGAIPFPSTFRSEDELLHHLGQFFAILRGDLRSCSFYKRTQGHGMRRITFSNYSELRNAIGRGSLVVVPEVDDAPNLQTQQRSQSLPQPQILAGAIRMGKEN